MTVPTSQGGPRPSRVSAGAVVFALLFVAFGTWALAVPFFGGPDEPAHVERAMSLLKGQVLGSTIPGAPPVFVRVRAPGNYKELADRIRCWTLHPDTTPDCAPGLTGSSRLVASDNVVGRYNPVYYAVVGLPSLLGSTAVTLYLMRLAGAALCAGLLTIAVLALLGTERPSVALAGLALAVTPMVAFLASVVNPSGLEASAAICLWAAGLVALDGAGGRSVRALVWMTVGACALIVSRGLSLLWAVAIIAVVAVAAARRPARRLLADRRLRVAAGVTGAVAAGALAWVVWARSLEVGQTSPALGRWEAARATLRLTGAYVKQIVGVLQWLDTPVPWPTLVVWALGVGALVVFAVAVAVNRVRLALVACILVTFMAPFMQVVKAPSVGLVWSGRYSLPLAVGIPVLAAYGLSQTRGRVLAAARRLTRPLVVAAAAGLVLAFVWAGHRNAVGASGPVLYLGKERWTPPVPFVVLIAAFTAAVGVLAGLYLRLSRAEGAEGGRGGTARDHAPAALPSGSQR